MTLPLPSLASTSSHLTLPSSQPQRILCGGVFKNLKRESKLNSNFREGTALFISHTNVHQWGIWLGRVSDEKLTYGIQWFAVCTTSTYHSLKIITYIYVQEMTKVAKVWYHHYSWSFSWLAVGYSSWRNKIQSGPNSLCWDGGVN